MRIRIELINPISDSSQTLHNTAYTTHFVRPNFGYVESSYMLETLGEMSLIHEIYIHIYPIGSIKNGKITSTYNH
ncbi:MAG: hypothetical protein AEth_00196 [Candidatus Argoarchaeum ethanivorans]|uniref:Uncharacterized protein n=1 Tax=Candidatus Argoarchaeum ethanivorans TaxID=2608793 RepID=A0A8B3S7N5_9EURY|nr:MAG: hypothetical protein AEth_00196 [Candidatus Argoarchaeum ethanivorans]